VPEQKFLDPITGAELVSLHWDFGLTAVDVAFGGTLLTKINDIKQLRETGMGGTTPDGCSLLIKLGYADAFEVTRNGQRLEGSQVNAFSFTPAAPKLLEGGAGAEDKLALDSAGRLVRGGQLVDPHVRGRANAIGGNSQLAMAGAQGWLLFFSIVQSIFTLGFAWLAFMFSQATESIDDAVLRDPSLVGTSDPEIAKQQAGIFTSLIDVAQTFLIGMFVFSLICAVGSWVLWKVANGPEPRKAFTISKWVAVVYGVLTLFQFISNISTITAGLIFGTLIMVAIEVAAFLAFQKAQQAVSHE
jgi:hypothetical protein